ncbi:NAD(P)-dependent oxidoreductase [Streptomyces sp. MCA2]|uniref:NAD-dependent epimerase/dehydratase family protein n=1 Tax=Streptomyces TaxID=1883 RepID=UPI0020226DF7|nr:NAD(P)-dependent oxidoreductase [Streptomyces sp. MCA2]MCL7495544.1 NAD(P)-dependent oxidoreductase [Streptomyces sp. MCA2]
MTTTDMPRRVAVLGATGCVGRHLCAAFAARGTDVVAIARRDAPHLRPHPFLSLDLARCTGAGLAAILADEGVDTVVNATLGWGSTPEEMAHSNVRPVERLLAALPRLPDPVRLVHLGTIHEYGPVPAGTSLDEDVVPRPASLYAQAKLTASRLVLDAVRRGEVQGSVLRLTNTVGPHPARESFFGALAARLRRTDPAEGLDVTVAAARRDYVDVRDAADAVLAAAAARSAEPLLNIGRGAAVDIHTMVRTLITVSGLPADAVRVSVDDVASRSAGADWIQVDRSRAERSLGWRPRHALATSFRDMWDTVGAADGPYTA